MNSLELAKQLNEALLKNQTILSFQEHQQAIQNNEHLKKLEIKIKAYQKKIVNQKASQDEDVVQTIKEYQLLKEEFEHHPLLVNYLYLKEEVDYLLQNINVQINAQLLNNDLTK